MDRLTGNQRPVMATVLDNAVKKLTMAAAMERIDGQNANRFRHANQVLRIFCRFSVTFAVALRVSITSGACFTIAS